MIVSDGLTPPLGHLNPDRYAVKRIFVVRCEDYVYLVPFVDDEHTVFHDHPEAGRLPSSASARSPTIMKLIPTRRSCWTPSSAASGSPPVDVSASVLATLATGRLRSGRTAG
jgi:hypothetical protein